MSLLWRTLLSFFTIILLQALLTGFFITNLIRRSNVEEARRELAAQAEITAENFYRWSRLLWVPAVRLDGDEGGKAELRSAFRSGRDLEDLVKSRFTLLGIDWVRIADPYRSVDVGISGEGAHGPATRRPAKPISGPFIRMSEGGRGPSLYAGLPLGPNADDPVLYLVKHLSESLALRLAPDLSVSVALYLGNRYVSGNTAGLVPEEDIVPAKFLEPYTERYGLRLGEGSYNAAIRTVGMVATPLGEEPLRLVTLLSDRQYADRLAAVRAWLLVGSLMSAVAAALVGAALSRNISHPVVQLARVMDSFSFDTPLPAPPDPGVPELRSLSAGFARLTERLVQDREEISRLGVLSERIIQSIPSGLMIVDGDLRIRKINNAFMRLVGVQEGVLMDFPVNLLPPEVMDAALVEDINQVLEGGPGIERRIRRTGGKTLEVRIFPVELESGGRGCAVGMEDISSRLLSEDRILLAEKLAVTSLLSAGVAHEINNPLASILINVRNLKDDAREQDAGLLRLIEAETLRIGRIVRDLLDFSASGPEADARSDLAALCRDAVALVRFTVRGGRRVRFDLHCPESLPVAAGADELKQVAINLLVNAADAVGSEGNVRVSVYPAGEEGILEVEDDGCGIAPELLPRIFDPFFTTKPGGTGLGLSVAYGIVTRRGGTIEIDAAAGRGTVFRVRLPRRRRVGMGEGGNV